ncbi:hypothetical protein [Muricauda sp. MAR_2010_75]|uniref:hypothetical protein n=1 Tax=Allomuricauda sp. MAR_2010_75 TaxID=1250232 RepID=UPI00056A07A6|nr:hypothetical protein [Muricauda sp. MAR_2010_75]
MKTTIVPKGGGLFILALLAMACNSSDDGPTQVPSVPIGLTAEPGNGRIVLIWEANIETDLSHYNIYQGTSADDLEKVDEEGDTSYEAKDLSNGTPYYFAIAAENINGGASAKSRVVSAAPEANCKIVSMLGDNGTVTNITYDGEGKIVSLANGDVQRTYVHTGNTIVASEIVQGNFSSKTIISLNESGLPTDILIELDEAGTNWINQAFGYNGAYISQAVQTDPSGGPSVVVLYEWEGGNLVSQTNGNDTTVLEYFEEHDLQQGDFLNLQYYLTFGHYPLYQNQNLIKSIDYGNGSVFVFDYAFDGDGNISTITQTSNSGTVNFNLQYQCD